MLRVAHGGALIAVLVCLAVASAASANTITTVAGGGSATPGTYGETAVSEPLGVSLPSPGSVAWSGDPQGMMYVVSSVTCALYWFDPDRASDDYGFSVEGGTLNDCSPAAAGYPTLTDAHGVKLAHPCCVTSDQRFTRSNGLPHETGPWVASTASGHVNRYEWFWNKGQTFVGQTADCATDPPTGGNTAAAGFCTITGLARQFQAPYDYAFGESGRKTSIGNLYYVDSGSNILGEGQVLNGPIDSLTFARNNNLLASDGNAAVMLYGCCPAGGTGIIGSPGFRGYKDGTPATSARFADVKGLTVGFDGSVYLADSGNCRIRRAIYPGPGSTVTTVAGNGCDPAAPLGDGGEATSANLDHPIGVAFTPLGLVISDTGHNRLRLIDRTSIVGAPTATTDTTPNFDIRSLDDPSHLKCTLNDVDIDCTNLGTLQDGQYTLKAWENGNAADPPDPPDPTAAVHTFKVDTQPPTGLALRSPAAGATGVPVDGDFTWDAGTDAVIGIDHYELAIDGKKNRDVPTSACASGVCTAKAAQALSEGDHDWQITAVDGLGHSSATDKRTFTAGGAPTASFVISPNPALVNRSVSFDASASKDESGIARYEWDLDGDGSFETDNGSNPTVSTIYPAPATVTIRLRVTDGVGKQSTAEPQSLRVTTGQATQNLIGVSINNGAQYTKDPNVTLTLKPPATANAVLVSNDGGFFSPSTFPIASTIKWKLDSSGPERLPKTVYVKFMLGPIISDNFTDDIILDEIPPVVQAASVTPPASAAGNAATAAKAKTYVIKVKAKDSNSGVGKVQVTANKKKPGKLLAYKKKFTVKSAKKPKFLRAQDRAGNYSPWKKLR